MRASVVRLRLNGVKHRCELDEGFIVVSEVTDHTCMAYRARSEALLYRSDDRSRGAAGVPLFEPSLLHWDERGIFLQGWEIGIGTDGKSVQHVQIWVVRPL